MSAILDKIIEHKKSEVRALRDRKSRFTGRTDSKRPFVEALQTKPRLAVIAEVKKASPSKGLIRADFDPVAIASQYQQAEASAVSVLTDERFFQGHEDYLTMVRSHIELPVLRKDFIIDPLQVLHTATLNADAMLLIAAALSDGQMQELYAAAVEMNITPLIEIHNGQELDRVMNLSPALIGINNRNLMTFETSIQTSLDLIPAIPPEVTVVSESGIFGAGDTRPLIDAGVSAILVGESLMRSDDVSGLINELRCE
ncbi:MAG: indole-3-glycerol phosphate synthase TrpC [Chitinivibrionales bacterium]